MKLIKQSSGKKAIKISENEWLAIGKKAGWMSEVNPKEIFDSLDSLYRKMASLINQLPHNGKIGKLEDAFKYLFEHLQEARAAYKKGNQ